MAFYVYFTFMSLHTTAKYISEVISGKYHALIKENSLSLKGMIKVILLHCYFKNVFKLYSIRLL